MNREKMSKRFKSALAIGLLILCFAGLVYLAISARLQIAELNQKAAGLNAKLTALETKLSETEAKLTALETKLSETEAKLTPLETKLAEHRAEVPQPSMPFGFSAHADLIVVSVDLTGADPAEALRAIVKYAFDNQLDILVLGCDPLTLNTSQCDYTPFTIYGSVPAGDKAARK